MKRISTLLALVFLFHFGFAQTQFQKTTGSSSHDRSYQLAKTHDGGFVATGYTEAVSGNADDAYLIKYDKFGEVEWAKTYGDVNDDSNWDVITSGSNIIGGGVTGSLPVPNNAGTISEVDSTGAVLWSTGVYWSNGNVEFYRIMETSTGHFVATGLAGTSSNQDDIVLCKFTGQGNLMWSKAIGSAQADEAMGMIETTDGHYLLAGLSSTSSGNGNRDFAAVKTDTAGNVIWQKNYGGSGDERMNSVIEVNNEYYFMGWSSSVGQGQDDIVVMKTDTAGNVAWVNAYGTTNNDRAFNMMVDSAYSSIVVAGYTDLSGTTPDRNSLLMSLDFSGNMNWAKSYGAQQTDGHWPTGLAANDDEGYYLLGSSNSFSTGDHDLYLVKTDASGNTGCNQVNPQYSALSVLSWSGSSFGTSSSVTLTEASLSITPATWNISSTAQCCNLYADQGTTTTLCPGDTASLGTADLSGYDYSWVLNSTQVSTGSSVAVPYGAGGTYNLTVSASGSNCGSTTRAFTVNDETRPSLGFNERYGFCDGEMLGVNTAVSLDSLKWYTQPQDTLVNTGNSYFASTTDTVFLRIVTSNQCKFADTIRFEGLTKPNVDLGPADTSICEDDSLELTAPASYPHTWLHNPGNTDKTIYVKSVGTYIVEAANQECTVRDTVNLTIDTLPAISLGPDQIICPGSSTVIKPSGNYDSFQWLHLGSIPDSIVVDIPDTIVAEGATNEGCVAYDTVVVDVAHVWTILLMDDTTTFEDSVVLDVQGGPWAMYQWNTGETSSTIAVTDSGWYAVTVADSNGCSVTDSIYANRDVTDNILRQANTARINVFPNPAGDYINIEFQGMPSTGFSVRIMDVTGKQILTAQSSGENRQVVSVAGLKPGFYLLEIQSAGNAKKVVRFVKR